MALEKTGERVIEELYQSNLEDYLIYLIQKATYQFALEFVSNMKVLDLGCGSGYGTEMLADHCQFIVGSDIDSHAITYAKEHYGRQNLAFFVMDNLEKNALPFDANTFDVIVSFQVIEHIKSVEAYCSEIKRVLKMGGAAIIATPDRTKRLFKFQKPWNMWHTKEYSVQTLRALLNPFFPGVEVFQMGGAKEMMLIDMKRSARIKWLTLPITLPFIPEVVRVNGLQLLKRIQKKKKSTPQSSVSRLILDPENISISSQEDYSVNLIAIGRKRDG